MLKMALVGSITKGFVGRSAAATQGNDCSTLQAIGIAIHVNNLKIAIQFNRTVVVDRNSCLAHSFAVVICAARYIRFRSPPHLYRPCHVHTTQLEVPRGHFQG